ncbi:MAG TPA: carboxylating nicotinate-nucleotide diphosphorylase [Candidatus Xenobia bacterium]|jgi:nicotinate-nucleotide pyrophosphorylase (carboxylating)
MPDLLALSIDPLIRLALSEDIGTGDVTSRTVVGEEWAATAWLVAKAPGILAGLPVARRVFELLDDTLHLADMAHDGEVMKPGQKLLRIEGRAATILTGERTALNFLSHLSGIASFAAQMHILAQGGQAVILDTRKTLPGYRTLAKHACRMGGIKNHRMGLFDGVLIKNNHLKFAGPAEAVRRARQGAPVTATIEIEVETLEQLREALTEKPDIVMLDNMDPDTLQQAIRLIGQQCRIEVSGGLTPDRIDELSRTGVHYMSMGIITNSAPAIDISLRMGDVRRIEPSPNGAP